MFAQFFGGYLFNHKLCTAEDLTQAFEAKKHTRLRLGVLAINAGLMTAEQVEHVNITQQSVDKRFGDLAVELGYVTADDVEKLLAQQPTDYLLLGQTLVNNGALTNAEFEKALKDYKAENQITDDISDNYCLLCLFLGKFKSRCHFAHKSLCVNVCNYSMDSLKFKCR